MNINDANNAYEGPGQSACFIVASGAPVEDAAEIVGITPEELAQCRAIAPNLYTLMEELADWMALPS